MLKKYFLTFLLTTLTLSNVKANFIPGELQTTLDAINYIVELNNISSLDSKNRLKIKISAAFSFIKNLPITLENFIEFCVCEFIFLNRVNKKHGLVVSLLSFLKLFSLAINISSLSNDTKIFLNAKKIAQANLKLKDNLANQSKAKQIIWLTANMLIPYLSLAVKRLIWNKSNLKSTFFYNDQNENDQYHNLPIDTALLEWPRALLALSEAWRRNKFYSHMKNQYLKEESPFLMHIEAIFSYPKVGIVVTGKVKKGKIKIGDRVSIIGSEFTQTGKVHSINTLDKELNECEASDNTIGILFKNLKYEDIEHAKSLIK